MDVQAARIFDVLHFISKTCLSPTHTVRHVLSHPSGGEAIAHIIITYAIKPCCLLLGINSGHGAIIAVSFPHFSSYGPLRSWSLVAPHQMLFD
jgi:hypothetical protein